MVKINKKKIINQNPAKSNLFKYTDHGNKKETSKSNIINNIATK